MKIIRYIFSFTLVLPFLYACSTLNKNECLNADWQTIGYQDGEKGLKRSRIGKHQSACSQVGVKVNLKEYLEGYQLGLYEYCTPTRGFQRGLHGHRNKGYCRGSQEYTYNAAYSNGNRIYLLKKHISENKKLINKYISNQSTLAKQLSRIENQLININLPKEKRKKLLSQINTINKQANILKHNLTALEDNQSLLKLRIRNLH